MISELQRLAEPMLITADAWSAWARLAADQRSAEIFGQSIELPSMEVRNGVAVIPIHGTVAVNVGPIEKLFGVVDMQDVGAEIAQAEANPDVSAIVFDIGSGGGTYCGTPELANRIQASPLPTFAFTASVAASAAYWIMSAADNVLAAPSATVGHVGTMAVYQDCLDMMEKDGVRTTVLASDPLKVAGHPLVHMTEEQRQFLMDRLDHATEAFRGFVAERRPMVDDSDMRGQTFWGDQAVDAGFIDAIAGSLEEVIELAR